MWPIPPWQLVSPACVLAMLLAWPAAGATAEKAPAAEPAGPSSTTATYGDWTVRCVPPPRDPAGAKVCEVSQAIRVEDRPGIVAQVAFGAWPIDGPLRLVVQLPNGVFLPPGARFLPQEGAVTGVDLAYSTCLQGCFADAEIGTDMLATLTGAKGPARLEFVNNARSRVALPVSLDGLKAALGAGLKTADRSRNRP